MRKVRLQKIATERIRKGNPILLEKDFPTPSKLSMDEWVEIVSFQDKSLGFGYLSKQNKGIGWLIPNFKGNLSLEWLISLFQASRKKRESLFSSKDTTAFRLFNGEGDGFGGFTIDAYENFAVFQWYNSFVYSKRELILEAFNQTHPEIVGIYGKNRFAGASVESEFLTGVEGKFPLFVKENGVNYATYLNEGWMTGIFLDQRNVRRRMVKGLFQGKSVLNMFSYTGAFSVAALSGGAKETTSVDLAKRSLEKTKEMFEVNQLPVDEQRIYVMDVFRYFAYAKKKGLTYDAIVLDPPSFARNGKQTFSVQKNYGELIEDSVEILNQNGGTIVASTNAANLSRDKFKQSIETALKKKKVHYRFLYEERLPKDFPTAKSMEESDYLKVYFIEVKR